MFEREIQTRALTRDEAELLVGSYSRDGRMLTADEILADPSLSRVTAARDIHTGVMKPPRTKTPFFLVKA